MIRDDEATERRRLQDIHDAQMDDKKKRLVAVRTRLEEEQMAKAIEMHAQLREARAKGQEEHQREERQEEKKRN